MVLFYVLVFYSQLTMNLEPSLDIDQLQDPVEFFTAFERQQGELWQFVFVFKNLFAISCLCFKTSLLQCGYCCLDARKEIEKQTGLVSTNSNQCTTSMAPRPRRPGIPG